MGAVVLDDMALPSDSSGMPVKRIYSSPIYELKFFHTAIRAELDNLHQDAMALESGADKEIWDLLQKYHFLRRVYRHHSSGEDEVRSLPQSLGRMWNVDRCCSFRKYWGLDEHYVSQVLRLGRQHQANTPFTPICTSVRKRRICRPSS